MTLEEALQLLEQNSDPAYREGLKRYAVPNENALGVRMPVIRKIGKMIGKNQELAEELWASTTHEAKHLGALLADPSLIAKETLQQWTESIYSWDLCDHLADITARTHFRMELVDTWIKSDEEFIKRSAIVTLVSIVLHDKKLPDHQLEEYLKIVEQEAWDQRNFVKKAVNWLLRQIGKKNLYLNQKAMECGKRLLDHPDRTAHWIAKDALKELQSEAVQERLLKKEKAKK
jgi:3-methyladenine DNA glycosylase AlkD